MVRVDMGPAGSAFCVWPPQFSSSTPVDRCSAQGVIELHDFKKAVLVNSESDDRIGTRCPERRGFLCDDVSASAASSTEQAQARQFGIYFGGMASQYDLCVKKGLLPKGDQSAEDVAKSILEKMRQFNKGTDQSAFVQQGWDAIKLEVAKHESEYTTEKCSWVANEWAKMVATMTPR